MSLTKGARRLPPEEQHELEREVARLRHDIDTLETENQAHKQNQAYMENLADMVHIEREVSRTQLEEVQAEAALERRNAEQAIKHSKAVRKISI